ncbi:MAG: hypothetical protein Q4D79_04905 [Propionibacteriaceae bacterium]|nr:hypothetical protein [Propionibacteriaceae bacterium]
MVRTLIKHEALRTTPGLGAAFGIATLIVLFSGIIAHVNLSVVSQIFAIAGIMVLSGLPVAVQLFLAVDFWRTSWGKSGYLTHSLPVKGSTILTVRLLWAFVVQVALCLWLLLGLLLFLYLANPVFKGDGPGFTEAFPQLLQQVSEAVPWWLWVLGVAAVLFLMWFSQAIYYFAATIGNGPRLASLGIAGPVVAWVVTNMVLQVVVLPAMFLPVGIVATDGRLHFASVNMVEALVNQANNLMPVGFFLPIAVVAVLLVPWMAHSWNHRISLR